MSKCKYCDEEIVWARRSETHWYPPFDSIEPVEIDAQPDQVLLSPSGGAHLRVSVEGLLLARPHRCAEREAIQAKLAQFEAPESRRPSIPRSLRPDFWSAPNLGLWVTYWKTPTRVQIMQFSCSTCDARIGEPCISKVETRHRMYLRQPHWQRSRAVRDWSLSHVEQAAVEDLRDYQKVHQLQQFFSGPGVELFGAETSPSVQPGPSGASPTPLVDESVIPVPPAVQTADSEAMPEEDLWWLDLLVPRSP